MMHGGLLSDRIGDYNPADSLEQENVLRELLQHLVLASLSRAGLFKTAAFHGGTCLRILHGTSRFSEDLDFLLKQPDPGFSWGPYLERIVKDSLADGVRFDIDDRSARDRTVRKALLKTKDFGRDLIRGLPFSRHPAKKIRIKLEVDTNPPQGSGFTTQYITFPLTAAITTQDLPSAFATKSHALLCRGYAKGRDWYDFIWFVSKNVSPRLDVLGHALCQQGPWAGRTGPVTADWYLEAMRTRIGELDWAAARQDVSRFILAREQESLALWKPDLFLYHLDRLAGYLGQGASG